MERFLYLNDLFDIYQDLLTNKQQLYFKEYYFHNLSYGEISSKYNISRNAIFRQLKLIEHKLENFEEKLQIYSRKQKIDDIIKIIDDKRIKDMLQELF